jgi:hypothetical protein
MPLCWEARSLLTVDGVTWDVSNLCSRKYHPKSKQPRRSSMSDFDERRQERLLQSEHMYPVLLSHGFENSFESTAPATLTRTSSWPRLEDPNEPTTRMTSTDAGTTEEEPNNLSCSSFDSDLSVEVSPGSVLMVHRAEETTRAMQNGKIVPVSCLACESDLLCIDCAAVVVCPICKCLTPLDDHSIESWGIGLGVLAAK